MKKSIVILPYVGVLSVCFYLLPMLAKNTISGMIILAIIIPLVCFALALIGGLRGALKPMFSVIVGIMFLPSVFIFLNASALIYCIAYGLLFLLGSLVGAAIRRAKVG